MIRAGVCVLLLICVSGLSASRLRSRRGALDNLQQKAEDALHNAQDLANQAGQQLSQGAQDLAHNAQDLAHQAGDKLSQGAQDLAHKAQDLANQAGQGLSNFKDEMSQRFGSNDIEKLMTDPQFMEQLQALDPTDPDYDSKVKDLTVKRLESMDGGASGITVSLAVLIASVLMKMVIFA